MAGIDHKDLDALADRIEKKFDADVAQLRTDMRDGIRGVHARVGEVRELVVGHGDRLLEAERSISEIKTDVVELRSDFEHHLDTHTAPRPPAPAAQSAPAETKPTNSFIAGVMAALLLLSSATAGIVYAAQGAWEYVGPLLKKLIVNGGSR